MPHCSLSPKFWQVVPGAGLQYVMLSFNQLTLRRGPRALIENLSLTIFAGQRVGLVGRNGCGKSSLFALILGEIGADHGECSLPRSLRIATVAQESAVSRKPAIDHVLDGDRELRAIEAALTIAEDSHDAQAMCDLHERLHSIDGYAAAARAGRLLHGLGFSAEEQHKPVHEFSGGWRMRLDLAQALMCRSDLLLLDEPTNHLDLDAVFWLQEWLLAYPGTLIVISHDRDFLDAVCTHTLHIAQGGGNLYSGNYSAFERLRTERMAQQSAVREQQDRQIAHLQTFVDRFRASAAKARMAQSRVKMIERIERVSVAAADPEFSFEFAAPDKLPAPLIRLSDVAVGYAAQPVLTGLGANIAPGDRIGLVGPNGAGKSTLIKLLAGSLRARSGTETRHPDLRVGYFAQHQLEQLDPAASPLDHFRKLEPNKGEGELRKILGGFHFSNERVFEPVGPFSGGEKARLALAMIVHQRPNLLLLDEPTNHLDLDMRQALALALQSFVGALVLVSHDRHLVASVCDVLWRVSDGHMAEFDGDLDDYARWLSTRERDYTRALEATPAKAKVAEAKVVEAKPVERAPDRQQRERERPLKQALRQAETRVDSLHSRLSEIERLLADEQLYRDSGKDPLQRLLGEQATLRNELVHAEETWLAAAGALERCA